MLVELNLLQKYMGVDGSCLNSCVKHCTVLAIVAGMMVLVGYVMQACMHLIG